MRRVAADETAWRARDATWSMVIAAVGPAPEQAASLKAWGRAYWQAAAGSPARTVADALIRKLEF